jgi:hypothetical protein
MPETVSIIASIDFTTAFIKVQPVKKRSAVEKYCEASKMSLPQMSAEEWPSG